MRDDHISPQKVESPFRFASSISFFLTPLLPTNLLLHSLYQIHKQYRTKLKHQNQKFTDFVLAHPKIISRKSLLPI
jgi:hypothetical protein